MPNSPNNIARSVHLFFMDGVGMGGPDPAINPFVTAQMPYLSQLFGPDWYLPNGRLHTERASLVPTDANLGLPYKPQSATGQATILTGHNVPQQLGQHYGPKPNDAIRHILAQGSLFSQVTAVGGPAALITPYPQAYFDAIHSGKRSYSAVPFAAVSAGLPLLGADDLRHGRAVSPDFTGLGWRQQLHYADIPLLTLAQAGQQISQIARQYQFSFFEHWPSDYRGHRGTLAEAADHLQQIDAVLAGLIDSWQDQRDLLIITSDHGNIEEKDHRHHTRNPVPTILIGPNHAQFAQQLSDLTDIAPIIRQFLNLPERGSHDSIIR